MDKDIKEVNSQFQEKQTEIYYKTHMLRDELAFASVNKLRIFEQNSEFHEEISKITRRNQRIAQEIENLKEFILAKTELEQRIIESVTIHEQSEVNLANQLIQIKSELLDAQTFYQEFAIKLSNLMIKCNAKLVLKRDMDGEYVAELQYKGKKEAFLIRDIESVYEHPTKKEKFVIKYKNKSRDIYTDEIEKIVPRTRELMQRCMR